MSNHPPLCVPYFRDDHVLAFDVREQKSKRDEGINLQVSSRESLEEGKKGTAISLFVLCASSMRTLPLLWPISVTLC